MHWIEWSDLFEYTVKQPLSADLRELLDEANKLLQLKAELGRLPASRLKTELIETIDEWFDVESSREVKDPSPASLSVSVKGKPKAP